MKHKTFHLFSIFFSSRNFIDKSLILCYYDLRLQKKVVYDMSIVDYFRKKSIEKRRENLREEAIRFMNVHFVREQHDTNVLSIKSDPKRMECAQWYEDHDYPNTFVAALFEHMKEKKVSPADLCNKYRLDKQLFQYMEDDAEFLPEKYEAVSLCIGLRLDIEHTRALLILASCPLSNSSKSDLIIRFCIENEIYATSDINYLLKNLCDLRLNTIR